MSGEAKVDTSVTTPIIYGRPRYLATILTVLALGVLVGTIINGLTYNGQKSASKDDVLGNRAITKQVKDLVQRYEAENAAHRERNEDAHACLIWLDVRILNRMGDPITIKLANPDPCAAYTLPGAVPPLPTTTTTQHRATTTRRQPATTTTTPRTTTTTTTAARPAPCPRPMIAGVCPTTP